MCGGAEGKQLTLVVKWVHELEENPDWKWGVGLRRFCGVDQINEEGCIIKVVGRTGRRGLTEDINVRG